MGAAELEKALVRLHEQDWAGAKEILGGMLNDFPEEVELLDRVRSYLKVADRALASRPLVPANAEEHYQVGVLRLNAGALDEAAGHFEQAVRLDPASDKAEYAFAATQALRGDVPGALQHLRRAVELNPENRILSASDQDLERLRDDPEFLELVGRRPAPRAKDAGAVADEP